ncbi:MAG: pirin family protein [Kofleriaceae bacterium]|nr:pirin family protein [Kofleriaceae bacterium]
MRLATHVHGPYFSTVSLRPDAVPMGHVLNIDHFHMSRPTFRPHPHAGFSAVTWMLPWSPGGFTNRDSRGDRSLIRPGDLHWTLAGAGTMHEEIPEHPGTDCEGLQIFVKLPEPEELVSPQAYHVEAAALPRITKGTTIVRVLVGELEGMTATTPAHGDTMLAHASVRGALTLHVPAQRDAFAMVLRGSGRVDGVESEAGTALPLTRTTVELVGDALEVLIGASRPMPSRPAFAGPFCMFDRARLREAAERFQAGAMGRLAPSPVEWS